MQTSVAKKIFAVGLAASTVLWAVPFAAMAAAHAEGTNVKKSDGTVGMIIGGQFRPYTSAGAFLSYGFNSWSSVVDANADDLALPTGAFIPPQDGTVFCATETKGTDVKGECALITGGQKASYTSAAVFTGLGFSFSRAEYGDSSFLAKTTNIDSSTQAHRPGVLVNNNGTVQLVGSNSLMGIPDLATFNSWGYSFADVVPANTADKAITQSGVMAARVAGQLSPSALASVPGVVNGSVSVSLASSNPAATALITNQGLANLAEFTFTGTGTVTGIGLKRIGISADTSLSNVYLFDGATRLTDGASVTSGGAISFTNASGIFTVNGSKTISVKADMNAAAGETIGVQLTSVAVANGTPATFAISGNYHSIASASLASVAFGAGSVVSDFDPNTDINVWQSTVTVGTRDVVLSRLALRQIGSVNSADIKNFRLFVDGIQIGQVQSLDANGYVTFSVNKTIASGSRVFKVLADVTGGSGRTVQMSLRGTYDVSVTDSQYGAGITPTGSFPIGDSTTAAIGSGSMTVVKATDSPSSNVTVGANDVPLAKYTFTAYGEAVKVETLRAGMITTGGTVTQITVRNVRVMVNGAQVGSTTNVPAAASYATGEGTQFTTNFMVNPGTPTTVELRGDIYDSEGHNDMSTTTVTAIKAVLVGGTSANNAVPQVSLGTLDVPSQINVDGNNLTVSTGSMAATKLGTYANQTVVLPQTAYKMAAFTLTGNNTEAVNVNTLKVTLTAYYNGSASTTGDFTYADVSDLYVKYGSNTTSIKGTLSSGTAEWSTNFALAKNESMPIEVYGTLGSSVTANYQIMTAFEATGITADSATTVYSGDSGNDAVVDGQILTAGTGYITASKDATSPVAALVDDSGTVTSAAFKFAATNDNFTITDITLTLPASAITAVGNVKIMDGSTVVVSRPANTTITINGLSVPVAAGANKILTVQLDMSPIGVGAGTSAADLTTTMTVFTSRNSGGTSDASDADTGQSREATSNPAGNAMYAFKAVPTVTAVALPSTVLTTGTQTISKFQISSGGTGTVSWKVLKITVSTSSNVTVGTSPTLYDADSNTAVSNVTCALASGTVTCTSTTDQEISGAKVYALKASLTGTFVAGDNVTATFGSAGASNTATSSNSTLQWSDESASSHTVNTSDWYGDYLVKNLPLDSQVMSK